MRSHVEDSEERRAPAVSVIIPAYNAAAFIGETLASVFAQTFTDYEVVVVNDGSPDTPELEKVIAPWRDRINYIVQENRGLSGARNTGLRHARGEFVALLDSDDLWEPNYLRMQTGLLEADPTIDVLYCDATLFGDERAGKKFMDASPSAGEVTLKRLISQECNVMVSVTARRSAIIEAGMFDESLRSSEDFDLWLRIAHRGGRIAYHREALVRYRCRPGSLSADVVWMCQHILRVLGKVEKMQLDEGERAALEKQQTYYQGLLRLNEGKRLFLAGDTEGAVERLKEANEHLRRHKLAAALFMLGWAPGVLRGLYAFRDRYIFRANTKP
ncbi:MAG: glycosyltransferase family 2 protein [Acidobacteriota bacterium]|nr:glycosyltransferase family 2 protein [Acidobacteriota bacterium]